MGESQLDLLERLLRQLEVYAGSVSRADLETDLDSWLKVSRALELVAQCCVDLAMELVAARVSAPRRPIGAPSLGSRRPVC